MFQGLLQKFEDRDKSDSSLREYSSSRTYPLSRKARSRNAPKISHMLCGLLVATQCVSAFDTTFYLDGIGYREQELQVAKGTNFQTENPTGVSHASFGGGTNIFIKGVGLAENPQANDVILYSVDFAREIPSFPLTEDDAFGSNTLLGTLAYRLPSIDKLFGVPMNTFDSYQTLTFTLSLISNNDLGSDPMNCKNTNNCKIVFRKTHTPVIFYMMPRVVYYESTTEVWFDPKNTPQLIRDLEMDEMQFINTKLGGSLLDFEDEVTHETTYSGYRRNKATGKVGELPIGNHDLQMTWETGYAEIIDQEATHCNYDETDCYQSKSVPVIFDISANSGYKTGGMNLTVSGYGFESGQIEATVAGKECVITQHSSTDFSCEVQPNEEATFSGDHVGQHGLRWSLVEGNVADDWGQWASKDYNDTLALSMQTPHQMGDSYSSAMRGWFVAPATTRYRFYLACDDHCNINLGNEPMNSTSTTKINWNTAWTDHRNFWEDRNQEQKNRTSEWISLEAGEHYFIQGWHYEGSGGDYFSAAVEIESTDELTGGHHQSMKEIQKVSVETARIYETTMINVTAADDGEYLLVFTNPRNNEAISSERIQANWGSENLKNAINSYYKSNGIGSNIAVNMTQFDADGNVTTNDTAEAFRLYYIVLVRMIWQPSASKIQVIKVNTAADIQVTLPEDLQLSATPLSNYYKIKCIDHEGYESYSDRIKYGTGEWEVRNAIQQGCDRFYDTITVSYVHDYPYGDNGVSFLIRFVGLGNDPGQFEIVSDDESPLSGTNITYISTTEVPYSSNLFYEPIPFEMLKTYETEPQVIVKVKDLPAVCHNLTCDFHYTEPVGELASFTFDDTTNKLVITGTNLTETLDEIRYVEFALSTCTVDESTLSNATIECTLDKEPTCGDWVPKLTSIHGVVPNAEDMVAQTVSCTVSSVFPENGLNLLGGDNLTISGNYLPHNLETSTVEIKFTDDQETTCVPQVSSTSDLVCLTSAFDDSVSKGSSFNMVIVVNNQTISNTITVTMKTEIKSSLTLTPASVSPVLKTKITVAMEADFPYTLERGDLSINATSVDNETYIRYLNVIEVNDADKTFVAMFGGAYSGQFQISIRHKEFGLVGTDGLILDVSASVASITPQQGSVYGGTLLTITGQNFGDVYTDNPVQISSNGGINSKDCFVESTMATEIKCRIETNLNMTRNQIDDVAVFLKTSEEAVCEPKSLCEWTWITEIPVIETAVTNYDETLNEWQVVVNGTDFTGDSDSVKLTIAGVEQTTKSVAATEAVFTIVDVPSQAFSPQVLYFDSGIPENHDALLQTELLITPKLISVSPSTGSVGGTLVTLQAPGIVVADSSEISVVDVDGNSVCDIIFVSDYGVIQCKTIAGEIASSALSLKKGEETFECVDCIYEQVTASAFPTVTSAALSGENTIVFTGENFDLADFDASATFSDIEADSIVVDSATQITATFALGVPIASASSAALLEFTNSGVKHFASSEKTLENVIVISDSTSGLQCSFAGGCTYEVSSIGLASMMRQFPDTNRIQVCGDVCEFLESESTSSVTKCKVPNQSTIYSNENFEIKQAEPNLNSGKIFGTHSDYELIFDNSITQNPSDTFGQCHAGMEFKVGHVGMLSQVKYYISGINRDRFIGTTKFQGSNDGTNYVDLFVVDENIHDGWNYHKWEDTEDYPKYRFYRMFGSQNKGCRIAEIQLTGVETMDDENDSFTCDAKLITGETEYDLNSVEYVGSMTPALTAVSPRYGTVTGGTEVTFTGTDMSDDTSLYTIIIDGIDCPVSAATTTSVTCVTGDRPGLRDSTLEIYIEGVGLVSNRGILFRYVSTWSDDTTWGGEFAPMEGETIYIPKGLNLLVDVDSTPLLIAVLVEGSLIFAPEADPNHHRTFDAKYIFVNGGTMEVGTEEFPYTSKITITMHSTVTDPYLPIYGNKVIGVRYGTLDMHGIERTPTWTRLETTAFAGSSEITLQVEVDWQPGELIAIASTSFESREAETRTIIAVDSTKKILTLDKPFVYKHYAATETYGDETIDMRAEVGLLSRNVVFRGDPETSGPNEYGATIFLHSPGDDSLTARLSYIECTDVGQAFKLGRYAIHFHMIGELHNSYAKGLALHKGFNRAFTLHGAHYLRLLENVAYEVKGHTVFIEDAIETNNYIKGNLIMKTMRSMSGLNTDQTPACFWITQPNNHFIDNAAAGSDRYGYWYDLQTHSIGPSANTNLCPENDKVGEFRGNTAHSMGRYGLRIFHNMVPREFPCKRISYDAATPDDPWHSNRPITANFYDYTGWKCKRNGAIAERVGDVRFNNFKTADNLKAGIEFSLTAEFGDDMAQINNALIIGKSIGGNADNEEKLDWASPHGIITPRTEHFEVRNIRFHNFDFNDASALGSCSHCFHGAATDSGARTVTFENLEFFNTPRKIRYQYPWKAIYRDLDGSLTGQGPDSYATFHQKHHEQPECQFDEATIDEFNGVVCNNNVQIRRVAFHSPTPGSLFPGMVLRFIRYDDDVFGVMDETEQEEWLDTKSNYGQVNYKPKHSPAGWASPLVTGHKYKMHFGMTGLDFETLKATLSNRWREDDAPIYMVHNFTDVREGINVTFAGEQVMNGTIGTNPATWRPGQNLVFNETEIRQLHFIINGKDRSTPFNPLEENTIQFTGIRCVEFCNAPVEEEVEEPEPEFRFWSDVANWPNETLPVEGDEVEIRSGWKLILDLPETPKIKTLHVNGMLFFSDEMNVTLHAYHVFVRAGELHIGNETHPHNHTATIMLYGERNDEAMAFDAAIEAGNKIIANVGLIKMFGKPRSTKFTRLMANVNKGDTTIMVEPDLDLVAGDRLALTASSYQWNSAEDFFIESYDVTTGKTVIDRAIRFHQIGALESTGEKYNGADLRTEVLLLTRNIRIVGEDVESWGGHIVTSDTVDFNFDTNELIPRNGQLIMDNVEMYNCSQIDQEKGAIRFEGALNSWSSVSNSTFHNGLGWGHAIYKSENIYMQNNIWWGFRPLGGVWDEVKNITFDGNVIAHVVDRETFVSMDKLLDKKAGLSVCAYRSTACTDLSITNNIVAGTAYAGFIVPGHNCGDENQRVFRDNIAHSIYGTNNEGHGAIIYANPGNPGLEKCMQGSHFTAWKCRKQGAWSSSQTKAVVMSDMTMIDNVAGFGTGIASGDEYNGAEIQVSDNFIYGEAEEISDCPEDGSYCQAFDKYGYLMQGGKNGGTKSNHITMQSDIPFEKIMGNPIWSTEYFLMRNKFIGFKGKTALGYDQAMFYNEKNQPDYIPMLQAYNNEFVDVKDAAWASLADPNPNWANLKDCGDFPCTAPWNLLFSFKESTWTGSKPSWATKNFDIIADNPGFAPYIEGCKRYESMNAWVCDADKLGILQFESEDEDKWDRSLQPVYVKKHGTEMENKLNSVMDHVWDGFYTGQVRLSRFHSIFQGDAGAVYDLNFTATPAKNFRFTLRSQYKSAGATLRIAYPGAESRAIYVDGQLVNPNQWNDDTQQYGEIKQKFCGENRYIGVQNILEFYIEAGCDLQIKPRNAIQTLVRMEWTMEEFFADGGTTSFIDRLTGSLGIHASTVKIVSVYEGSLIVNYEIEADEDDEDGSALAAIKERQDEMFSSGAIDLGAPVLAYEAKAQIEVQGASYTPVTIKAPTYSQSNSNSANEFVPIEIVTQAEVNFQNQTVQVELDPEQVITTETVFVDGERKTKIISISKEVEEDSKTGIIILVAVLSIFTLLITAGCIRYVVLKKTQEKLDVEMKITRVQQAVQDSEKKAIYGGVQRESHMQSIDANNFEQQYDANNDYAIFGIGSNKTGGIQTMQEKMNMADAKKEDDSSESDMTDRDNASSNLPSKPSSKGSNERSTVAHSDAKAPTTNSLPEDKEIHSDDE